jgi:hypothetical protein
MEKQSDSANLKTFDEGRLLIIEKKRIFFGHQSVGYNIIDGVKDIIAEYPACCPRIVETIDPLDFESPVFGHARIGRNMDPYSKIGHFKTLLGLGIGNKLDVACMKLCYVDIDNHTDIEPLFQYYKRTINELSVQYPHLKFIHATVPLEMKEDSIKAVVKKVLGKKIAGEGTNIGKRRYNDLLAEEYDASAIFDIASIESTYPDGTRNENTYKNETYYSLVPQYTNDGGHLNHRAGKIVAEQLLSLLAG